MEVDELDFNAVRELTNDVTEENVEGDEDEDGSDLEEDVPIPDDAKFPCADYIAPDLVALQGACSALRSI